MVATGTLALGFSFSDAGRLGSYILGALHTLVTLRIINSTTPLAGSSGGRFIAAAFHATNSTIPQLLGNFTNLLDAAQLGSTDPRHPTNASTAAAINAHVYQVLDQMYPDPGGYLSVRGKAFVALTRYPELTTELVTNFSSNDDMKAGLRASGECVDACHCCPPACVAVSSLRTWQHTLLPNGKLCPWTRTIQSRNN
jgi:hypothetical protein